MIAPAQLKAQGATVRSHYARGVWEVEIVLRVPAPRRNALNATVIRTLGSDSGPFYEDAVRRAWRDAVKQCSLEGK